MIKICLCPTSIAWIGRNLKKSAKAKWRAMIQKNKPSKRRKSSRRASRKSRKSSRRGGKTGQQNRMRIAARKCKGKKGRAFKACMKRWLKKR